MNGKSVFITKRRKSEKSLQNQIELETLLKDYLSSTNLQEYEIDILYTSNEKTIMEQRESIKTDELTFSSNLYLRKYHKKREVKK